jgi:hypothetical protein
MSRYTLYRSLSEPQGRSGRLQKISPLPGFDPRTAHPVASCYTNYVTQAHNNVTVIILIPITTGLQYQYKFHLYGIPNKSRNLLTVLKRLPFQNAIFNVTLRHGLSVPQRVRRDFLHFSYIFNGSSRSVLIAAKFFQPWFVTSSALFVC